MMAAWAVNRVLLPLALLLPVISAATVTYDFDIGWVTANPDGQADRPVIGINGKWPIPRIEADVGDRIIVNVVNSLGNQSTSLHFHGLFQNTTTHMDGPVQVTQCDIPPGSHFTYDFKIEQPGTYWYHSHTKGQYPDGLRGPLIIHDPDFPYKDKFDEEVILTVTDWYHDEMPGLIDFFMSKANPSGAEPVPKAALFNDTLDVEIAFEPGKTYLFRMMNIGAFAGQYIWFEGHNISIVEVDGVYSEPAVADMIYLSAAQRCSFLITAKNETDANFPFVASMDTTLFDALPDDLNYNVTGWLMYNKDKPRPEAGFVDELDPFDDVTLVPFDKQPILGEPDQTVQVSVIMDNLGDGANYAFFNDITYKAPKVPTLYTALSAGDLATNAEVYGKYSHSFVLKKDEIIQIEVDNLDSGKHPFHLHGHHFQAVWRSEEEAGPFADSNVTSDDFIKVPMRRDTLVLYPEGNIVLRFKANNPGIWLFHCHLEWHVISGLMLTFVEAPLELQKTIEIPKDHLDACNAGNVPTTGNAAANSKDFLDLNGQPSPPDPLPEGFTPRGIVALTFSCISGILGVAVIAWYGMAADHTQGGLSTSAVGGGVTEAHAHSSPAAVEEVPAVSGGGGSGVRT